MRARRSMGRVVLAGLVSAAPAACMPTTPLGRPVPTAESRLARAELASLLLNSGRYREAAREFAYLLGLDRGNVRYRLGLARALAWDGRHREAEHHLRILASIRPGDPEVDRMLRSVRANLRPSVAEAEAWVAERPDHSPYRLALARALASAGRLDSALREYDRVAAGAHSSDALVERAALHLRRGDLEAAERDLRGAIRIESTAAAWVALGDVQRRRGGLAAARESYQSARREEPDALALRAAFAQLARDERPPPVSMTVRGQERGWELSASGLRDNARIGYTRIGARRGFSPGGPLTGSVGLELRDLREETPGERLASSGVAGDVALALSAVRGSLFGAAGGTVGGVYHDGTIIALAEAALRAGYRSWVAGVEVATGPAYPTLLTGSSLVRPDRGLDPLRQERLTVSAGGPINSADAAIVWERAEISDGNVRFSFTVAARYPLTGRLSATYTGNGVSFTGRSPRYWDPENYLANALGLELAHRRVRGLSYAARAHAGVAVSEAPPFLRAPVEREGRTTFLQLDLRGQLGYRGERWDLAATYGFGTVSDYRRHEGSLTLRIRP